MSDLERVDAMVEVDIDALVGAADPMISENMQLFMDIGTHCKSMDAAHEDLGAIVRQLRAKKIQLQDWASINLAKWYIRQTHERINDDSLDKYTGHLRQLLRMREEHLPVRMSITAALPKWITVGDEVDGQDVEDAWWHGVALEVSSKTVKIFWVGYEPKCLPPRSRYKSEANPEVVNKKMLRAHEPDAADVQTGPHQEYDVAWIKKNQLPLPKSFSDVVDVSSDSETDEAVANKQAGEEGNVDQVANQPGKRGKGAAAANKQAGEEGKADQAAAKQPGKRGKGAAAANKRKTRGRPKQAVARKKPAAKDVACAGNETRDGVSNDSDDDDDDDDNDDNDDDDADDDGDENGDDENGDGTDDDADNADDDVDAADEDVEGEVDVAAGPLGEDADAQVKFLAMRQVFLDVEAAIICLMGLDLGLPVHASLFADFSKKLVSVARFSAVHYCNSAYDTLASETLTELAHYRGQEKPKLPHTTKFLKALSEYGFCITPRLWKKEEIVCIAIALLDPRLNFTGIRQKDGVNAKTAFRGMAVLDPRIQRIFYARLKAYGFVNPRFHPEKLQSFSSVVINGGGSWQQETTWEFPVGTRFQMDTRAVPFMIEATTTVGALEADGVYVATTTKQNGKPVYVQVSKHEFDGWKTPGQSDKQIGLNQCIKPKLQKDLRKQFLDSQGSRLDACSPRVLVSLSAGETDKGETKWGIQLLPGYGSDFFIFEFLWNDKLAKHANIEADCFASVNFDNFEANCQRCCVKMAHLHTSSSSVLTYQSSKAGHVFSFGPMKIAIATKKKGKYRKFVPTFLLPQGFHCDGPQVFDANLYDSHGILKTDAPATCRKAKGDWTDMWDNPLGVHLPEHIGIMQESFSALFGVFRGTYIQTPPSIHGERKDALNVVIPLGCAILFTFAWKHRGKGDGHHTPTQKSPVDVHARPHFYCYSTDMRRLPTIDFEASLEFISICAQKQPDTGSQLQILDTLQTFDRTSAIGHWDVRDIHSFFLTQKELESYVSSQLHEQRETKQTRNTVIKDCCDWTLKLNASQDSSYAVSIVYRDAADLADHCITIASACFDSDRPSFKTSTGLTYNLVGFPRDIIAFPATTPDSSQFASEFETHLLPIAKTLTVSLCDDWCESRLALLLSVLDAHAIEPHSFTAKGLEGTYCCNREPFMQAVVQHSPSSPVYFVKRKCIILIGASKEHSSPDIVNVCADVESPGHQSVDDVEIPGDQSVDAASAPPIVGLTASVPQRTGTLQAHRSTRSGSNSAGQKAVVIPLPASVKSPSHQSVDAAPRSTKSAVPIVGLPAIARGLFPRDVPAENIIWDAWSNCVVRGVGECNVWNVYTEDRRFDSIAIRLVGTSDIFNVVDKTTHYDERSTTVICTQVGKLKRGVKRQFVHFQNVCNSFAAWAEPRGRLKDFSAEHEALFRTCDLVRVECGGSGNCFYHSCMFWLQMFRPDEAVKTTHFGLRTATVNHLKKHYTTIMAPDPEDLFDAVMPVHRLLPGALTATDDVALELLVQDFCLTHGKRGEYVEDPIIRVFAVLMNINVIVYHTRASDPIEINVEAGIDARNILILWCDGQHYMVRYRPLNPQPFS